MHKLGIVLACLVIVAALASSVLTAKLVQVRNSWTAKSSRFDQQYTTVSTDLAKAAAELQTVRQDIETTLREWGGTFSAETQIANPAEGRLQIDAGTNLGLKEQMVVYGFQVLPDGSSLYRGPFSVATAQADRSVVVPKWRLRPEDLQAIGAFPAWQPGTWRWRTVIPAAYSDRFDDQAVNFTKADETLGDRLQSLAIQQRLVADTQRQIDLRNAELVGGDNLPKDPALNPEDREGLVAPLESEEISRNKLLVEIDRLRRQVREEREKVQRLQAENLVLSEKLPQPASTLSNAGPATDAVR